MESYRDEPPCRMRPKPGKIVDNQDLNQARQSLAWKVRCRSNPEDLFSKGILPDKDRFANPYFLEQKRRLSMAKTSDTIRRKLDNRPTRDSLQDKNILRSGTHTSPLIQASQVSLHRKRTADLLNRQLSERPGPIDLISKGILPAPPVGSGSNAQQPGENTQSFFQKLAKAARRDSYSSNEEGGWSPETTETGSNISTDSILRTHKTTGPLIGLSKNSKSKKSGKQTPKQKQTNKHYNFHVYTASNYRKEPPARTQNVTMDATENGTRISRDKKQRSSFEVCVNQQQFLLQLQVIQRYPEMKDYITPDVVKKLWGHSDDAENLVTDFFTQCKITQIGLQERTLQDLRNICKHNSLATTGKKAELIERILNYQKSNHVLMPENPPELSHKDSNESEMKSPQVQFKLPNFDDKNNYFKPLNPIHTSLPAYLPKHHPELPKKIPLLPDPTFITEMPNLQLKLNNDYSTPIQPLSYPSDSNCSLLTNGSLGTDPLDMLQPSIQPGDLYTGEAQFTDASSFLTTNTSEGMFTPQQPEQQKFYQPMDTAYYPPNSSTTPYADEYSPFPHYNDPNPLLSPATYTSDVMLPHMTEYIPVDGNCNIGYQQPVYPMDPNQNYHNYFANH